MTALSKLPATIVTGFLGAGKTTLVRHLLANAGGRRIALIVNEFGDVGIDGDLLAACGVPGCGEDDIIELANGCLCCTVADEFLPAMERLLDREHPPEHIVIETSGLALPKPLVKAFHWPAIRRRVTVDGVVAVVDAHQVAQGRFADPADAGPDHDNPLEEVFADQLATADLVLLNKTDLVEAATLLGVRGQIEAGLRPGTKVIETRRGAVDPLVLLGLAAMAEDDLEERRCHHDDEGDHDHDDFTSFAIPIPELAGAEDLEARLVTAIAAHDILRLKGFLALAGTPARQVVQAVGPRIERYFDRPWGRDEARQGRLVVIGRTGLDRDAVTRVILG